ncbi:TPA: hypothetical protein P5S08_003729 [Salmonella enterica subsp. enterica serovar Concord]|nr:hypothetical protein [Salmonella enterica subsp. enterica serovar Concord]
MMIKSYPGITDPMDYARFCDVNSFDPESPYIRQYYKKSLAERARHEHRLSARRASGKPLPVFAIGLTSAIELAVQHINDNSGYSRPDNYRCVACNHEFFGQRICPRCGNHVYCVEVSHES